MKFYEIERNEHTRHYAPGKLPTFIDWSLVQNIALTDCDQKSEAVFTDEAEAREAFRTFKSKIDKRDGYPNGHDLTATVYVLIVYEAEDLDEFNDGYREMIGGDFCAEFDNLTDIPDTVIYYRWTKKENLSAPNNGYNDETESIAVHRDYTFGDWLNDQGAQFELVGNTYYITEDGERTGEAFLIVEK